MLEFISYRTKRKLSWFIVGLVFIVGVFNVFKSLPDGVSMQGDIFSVPEDSIVLLTDETYVNKEGERILNQEIFDEVISMIEGAEKYILIDMFLFNNFQGSSPEEHRGLSGNIVNALIAQKKKLPEMEIVVITDPINTAYGGDASEYFLELENMGISLVMTDLTKMRDSNPLYSAWWRTFISWLGNSDSGGFWKHPFDSDGYLVTMRSWLSLLNFKANHRKLIVSDYSGGSISTLVTSANPHDASSAHGNIAIKIKDGIWQDVILSEAATAAFSGVDIPVPEFEVTDKNGVVAVQLLTEGAIRDVLLDKINSTIDGDTIDIAVFYMSERALVSSIIKASKRGVDVRIILDPNKDAFGHQKNGIPNRQVADEIMQQTDGDVEIRWCDTHGEQCHAKMALTHQKNIGYSLIVGSANFTRRNIDDYNLETNVGIYSADRIKVIVDAYNYFERMWENELERGYTVDYEVYAEKSLVKTIIYRIMELTGLSTF